MRVLTHVLEDVKFELGVIEAGQQRYNSAHEGYAVLLEELKELEAEVFKKPINRSLQDMYMEACQVAAVAIRFMTDCCGDSPTRPVATPLVH